MTKQISVTFSDWVYDAYLSNYHGNRAKYIEGNFVKGVEVEAGTLENNKQKIISQLKELREKEEQIRKLQLTIESLKKKLGGKDPELQRKINLARSIKASGALHDRGKKNVIL